LLYHYNVSKAIVVINCIQLDLLLKGKHYKKESNDKKEQRDRSDFFLAADDMNEVLMIDGFETDYQIYADLLFYKRYYQSKKMIAVLQSLCL